MSELLVDDSYKNIRIKVNGNIIATQEIIDRVSITYGCTDGSAPAVGTTYSPHCDVEINSNEIYGDSRLDAIKMGAIFVVECEFEYGTYTPLGRFEIGQPVQNTDDYAISFSGEGMLGSVLARKKMNWANMKQYSDKGVLTVAEALELVHIQFPTITIQTPSGEYLPDDFSEARIVVPTSLKKWKKGVIYKKRFVKLTVRDFIAGIAFMMGGNVIEYGSTIRIVTMKEALGNISSDSFTADSYDQGYTYEKKAYAPKEVILKTYETTAVQTKRKNSSTKTYGYCYTTECECASVYNPTIPQGENKYTVNVDCQWIGRSFEAFYFSGSVNGGSGIYDDATPIHEYPSDKFDYTPCMFNFSGWNEAFKPSFFINVQGIRKNTETQVETPFTITAYIMEMTFEWNGTISVSVNSGYNGDSSEITVTIGTNELSNAWDNGTNIPEFANEVEPEPIEGEWIRNRIDGYNSGGSASGVVFDGKVHILSSLKYWVYDTDHIASVLDNDREFLGRLVVFNNSIHRVGAYREDNPRITYVEKLENNAWIQIHSFSEEYSSGILVTNSACLYRNSIVLIGNYNDGRDHSCIITWNGTTTTIKEIPFSFSGTTHHSFEYNGVAYWFGDFGSSTKNYSYVAYDGTSIELHDINNPSESIYTLKRYACVYNDNIHGINLFGSSSPLKLLELFHDEWVEITDSPFSSGSGGYDFACEYNGKLTLFMPYYVYTFNPS